MDHREAITALAVCDGIPIGEHLARADARFAAAWWHWWFLGQTEKPAERVICARPGRVVHTARADVMGEEAYADLRAALRDPAVVHGMCEDYRAGLTVDRRHDDADRAAGRRVACATLVLWSEHDDLEDLYGDPRAVWRAWSDDVGGTRIPSGHHMAEEAPEAVAAALRAFLAAERGGRLRRCHPGRAMDQLFDAGSGRDPDGPTRGAKVGGRPAVVPESEAPLAARMRPRTLDEVVGQEHLLGRGQRAADGDRAGPARTRWSSTGRPGTGKTTLARIVADGRRARPSRSSARSRPAAPRSAGSSTAPRTAGRPPASATILFLDEIHRFNKAQQDALLPAVEEGLVTLIGATTENPYFEVNAALLSRTQVYELHALTAEDVEGLLRRALDRGRVRRHEVDDEALSSWPSAAGGDARTALAALELAAETTPAGELTLERAEDALQRRALRYDHAGDQHYDTISAWIKATRGSDPDASLYYLAVMLEGGEDPRFIARRMVDPGQRGHRQRRPAGAAVAIAAAHAVEHVGMPEAQHALAQARRLPRAGAEVQRGLPGASARPAQHVRDHGAKPRRRRCAARRYPAPRARPRPGLRLPARPPGPRLAAGALPDALVGERFYEPDDAEAELRDRLQQIRRARGIPDS